MERKIKIVVMGGSFNPPTVAHFKLMKAAIDAIDASIGFFFPAKKKKKKKNNKRLIQTFDKYNQTLMQPSSVVIYSFLIRSFSHRFPFQKGKNEGNISKNDKIKNDTTSSPKGTQKNVGNKYATLSER